jgi:hypothetical protein
MKIMKRCTGKIAGLPKASRERFLKDLDMIAERSRALTS